MVSRKRSKQNVNFIKNFSIVFFVLISLSKIISSNYVKKLVY